MTRTPHSPVPHGQPDKTLFRAPAAERAEGLLVDASVYSDRALSQLNFQPEDPQLRAASIATAQVYATVSQPLALQALAAEKAAQREARGVVRVVDLTGN